jgi:uncharacterized membrane protein
MNRLTLPLRVWLRSKRLVSRNFRRVRSVVTAAISVPAASAADDLVDEERTARGCAASSRRWQSGPSGSRSGWKLPGGRLSRGELDGHNCHQLSLVTPAGHRSGEPQKG